MRQHFNIMQKSRGERKQEIILTMGSVCSRSGRTITEEELPCNILVYVMEVKMGAEILVTSQSVNTSYKRG